MLNVVLFSYTSSFNMFLGGINRTRALATFRQYLASFNKVRLRAYAFNLRANS
ncbi:hypothetical protein CHCC4186_2466 [Bacillus paralicheniformis]|nr:hypothetical protein CHCC4186_2466 [Bacillus paralicheniformis]